MRTRIKLVSGSVALTLAALASACSVSNDSSAPAGKDVTVDIAAYSGPESSLPREYPDPARPDAGFKIGFLNPVAGNENLKAIQDAAQQRTEALGGTFIAKDDQNNVSKQIQDFNQLLAQDVDAIIVYPLDPKGLAPSLAEAADRGIPVIGYDVTTTPDAPLPDGYATQILQGRDWNAYLQAQAMAEAVPHGKVGVIGIAIPVPGLKFLTSRTVAYARQLGLDVVAQVDNNQGDSMAGGQEAATTVLSAHADLDGIIAFNDPTAVGASAAARTSGRKVVIVGNNGDSSGLAAVRKGEIAATFQNDAVGQGVQAVNAAVGLVVNPTAQLPRVIVRQPTVVVTRATVGDVKPWARQLADLAK